MKGPILIAFLMPLWSSAACLQNSLVLKENSPSDLRSAENTIEAFQQTIDGHLPPDHNLIIRIEALNPRVNADIVKTNNDLVIQVLGGMLRHRAMTPETLQLLLCHEIGHFLGGIPLKSRKGWSSTEGQSDYYSGLRCAHSLGFDEASFTEAALKLTSIYAEVGREAPPQLDRCDDRVVERTNFGYPSAQCRLDTLISGWTGQIRPKCWFSE